MIHLKRLREHMVEKGIDAFLCLDELNQRYLCGFAFTDGALLITKTRSIMITDFRYYEHAQKEAYPEFEITMPEKRRDYITEALKNENAKVVALEGASVAFAVYEGYKKNYPDFEFVDIGNTVEVLRQIKTPEEIAMMQKAQDITDLAFKHVLSVLNPDMTELDVAVELEYAMRKNGASAFAFDTIAVSGDGSALPHGTPRNVKLRQGFLTMDFGAKFNGYCSDMTRTVVIGRATDEIKKVYNTVLDAQLSAIDYLKAGADCGEADKIARDIINKEYDGTFGHSLGHGVGLFIHETPGLSIRGFDRKLRVGEVVTVEPGIYLLGKYGCRIEDMVAIEEGGVHNFTHSTKELIEIC